MRIDSVAGSRHRLHVNQPLAKMLRADFQNYGVSKYRDPDLKDCVIGYPEFRGMAQEAGLYSRKSDPPG